VNLVALFSALQNATDVVKALELESAPLLRLQQHIQICAAVYVSGWINVMEWNRLTHLHKYIGGLKGWRTWGVRVNLNKTIGEGSIRQLQHIG